LLDRWLIARLNETIQEATKQSDAYQIARAVRPLRDLVDDLSNWYVRRSRRRFWKSEDDVDKHKAYVTLHYVLARMCQLLAPWSPFLSDMMWRELTVGTDEADSVHLTDWPEAGKVDEKILSEMMFARLLVTDGLAARAAAKLKVRQPLSKLTFYHPNELSRELEEVVREEVNVKEIRRVNKAREDGWLELDTEITPELKAEGMVRDVVRHVQNARKESGLEVDDRIVLTLQTEDKDLAAAVKAHAATIKNETLAVALKTDGADDQVPVKVSGVELYVGVDKSK
jgi:isoleucyl-tRNA synthetase